MSGKQYVVVISLLLVILVLLNLPSPEALRVKAATRDNLTPFESLVTFLSRQVRGLGWYLSGVWHAPESEQALRTENAELRRELWSLRGMQEENAALREMAGVKQQRKERLLLAEVVARGDATGWWQTIRVNRGARDGVRPGLPVLTSRGLVGRTTEVAGHSCEVLLITDPTSQVSCRVGQAGTFGVLRGEGVSVGGDPRLAMLQNTPQTKLEYLPADQAAAKDDEVFTSGLGGIYPGGIPIGRISVVRLDPSQLYMEASVQPAAELSSLHYVFIMLTAGGVP
ncbi:MAG: rod shape-determining protein MreC [Lentisphaerae bacterium]|nr:rod shape-determining protein MreC [Lentisphaerota bacterium]